MIKPDTVSTNGRLQSTSDLFSLISLRGWGGCDASEQTFGPNLKSAAKFNQDKASGAATRSFN